MPTPRILTLQLGVDYTKLRDHLVAGEWREAEDEHRAVLIRMAGADAEKRGWVYFTGGQPTGLGATAVHGHIMGRAWAC